MSYNLGLTDAGENFGPPFACPGSRYVQLMVSNGACVVQFGTGIGGVQWGDDSFRVPGIHVVPGPIDAVRVKRKIAPPAGQPNPQYSIDAYA